MTLDKLLFMFILSQIVILVIMDPTVSLVPLTVKMCVMLPQGNVHVKITHH